MENSVQKRKKEKNTYNMWMCVFERQHRCAILEERRWTRRRCDGGGDGCPVLRSLYLPPTCPPPLPPVPLSIQPCVCVATLVSPTPLPHPTCPTPFGSHHTRWEATSTIDEWINVVYMARSREPLAVNILTINYFLICLKVTLHATTNKKCLQYLYWNFRVAIRNKFMTGT